MRSSACDTLTRLCVRHVLCWSTFPLVPALGSTDSATMASTADRSAAAASVLFAGFMATMAGSDFSCPCIIGYGSSPSRCGPGQHRRWSNAGSPRFRCDPFVRDVAIDPGRASAPRVTVPHMLPSTEPTVSAPTMLCLSWLIPTPHRLLCTLRGRRHRRPRNTRCQVARYGLAWAGLSPARSRQLDLAH